ENKTIVEESLSAEQFLVELERINSISEIKLHKQVKHKKKTKTERTLVAHISDTHIGCNIEKNELGGINEFNNVIAARRFAFLFKEIANYKVSHRNETELVLVLNGDIFAGVIHSQESVDPMATQFANGVRIFAQGISYLSQHFKKINVVGVTGNHDRYMHKDNKGRQTDRKWDSFTTNLYVSLREIFQGNKDVNFYIPETPYAIFDVMGHKFMATHGDTVINLGNPHKSVNIDSLTKQVNSLIASQKLELSVLMVGHVHKKMFFSLDNGTDVAMNGSLSGTDSFANSLGVFSNQASQQFFEVTKEYKMGDMRFVELSKADEDKTLDKIIEPLYDKF
ncbi:MAG: metallophosphoesterase, partial [Nitrososphaeraceae archaeon]|nr:metallophosphoesterase [Nitrososphaeraceae archaeon]